MQEFLSVVKTDPKLWQMIDQQQLKQQFNDKVNNRQTEVQLVPIDNDRKISNRYMANMLQLQNNETRQQQRAEQENEMQI